MFNYYIYNQSYENANSKTIELNLQDLNDLVVVDRKIDDSFLKHDSIWSVKTVDGEFGDVIFSKLEDKHLSQIVLPKLFNFIDSIPFEIENLKDFDNQFKIHNAFYGINFTGFDFDSKRCITDKSSYVKFRKNHLWDLTPKSFWEKRDVLFSKIILCGDVENDVKKIGGTYLEQIVTKLKELDKYLTIYWKEGAFNYKDANANAPLNISPESSKTMEQEKFYNQHIFSMPDGRRLCFDLHIKTGNLRFHFYPEDGKIYVGYIGKHLGTDKFN